MTQSSNTKSFFDRDYFPINKKASYVVDNLSNTPQNTSESQKVNKMKRKENQFL